MTAAFATHLLPRVADYGNLAYTPSPGKDATFKENYDTRSDLQYEANDYGEKTG